VVWHGVPEHHLQVFADAKALLLQCDAVDAAPPDPGASDLSV
jgi:hypothetical protein